jgi:hypothetical protein
MTDLLETHRIRIGYANETILVEGDDDVEAHGMLGVAAAVVIMAGGAGGTLLAGAGTALAPEPAQLTGPFGSASHGSTAEARFVNTNVETTVVKWPGSWTASTTLAPGTPCSTVELAPGEVATRTIQATGNYRKCM